MTAHPGMDEDRQRSAGQGRARHTGAAIKPPAWQILMLRENPAELSSSQARADLKSPHSESNVQCNAADLWLHEPQKPRSSGVNFQTIPVWLDLSGGKAGKPFIFVLGARCGISSLVLYSFFFAHDIDTQDCYGEINMESNV